jgi:hypothetical protein
VFRVIDTDSDTDSEDKQGFRQRAPALRLDSRVEKANRPGSNQMNRKPD